MNKCTKFASTLILWITVLFLSGCSALLKGAEDYPVANTTWIHDNPQVGDYAKLKNTDNNAFEEWRVQDIKGDRITITREFNFDNMAYSLYTYTIDAQGNVYAANVKLEKNGKALPVKVAANGEYGSKAQHRIEIPQSTQYTVLAGKKFKISELESFTIAQDGGSVGGMWSSSVIAELSDEVPFRALRIYTTGSIDSSPLLDVTQSLMANYDDTASFSSIFSDPTEGGAARMIMEVYEFGYGQ